MAAVERDDAREERIMLEIVADAKDSEERVMGWYYYLEEQLHLPFPARCIAERAKSPLRVGDKVEVVGMAPEDECEHEMFVTVPWERRRLSVPLSQLEAAGHVDGQTRQAIADWHYWVRRGYEFG